MSDENTPPERPPLGGGSEVRLQPPFPGMRHDPQSNPFINDVEYVDDGPLQCPNNGCGVLLNVMGECPRCTSPQHVVQAPKRNAMRVQCDKLGCGCVLDKRGLCPRCYPVTPEE